MTSCSSGADLRVFDITVVSGERLYGRVIDHSRNARRNFGVLCVWKGETTFCRDFGGKVTVAAGQLAVISKNEKYTMKYTAPCTSFVVVNFDMHDDRGDMIALFDGISAFDVCDEATERLARTMKKFELCGAQRDPLTELRKRELAYRMLGNLYVLKAQRAVRDEGDAQILGGVRLLEETYLENLPINAYAEASHVSVNTFRRAFQKQFGLSPLKYRNRLRIDRARELLSEGDLTVREAAYAAGFDNIGYFCRYYRRETGETPSETKRKNR